MEEAIQAVERVKEKKQEEVEKLEQAIVLLQGVDGGIATDENEDVIQDVPFDNEELNEVDEIGTEVVDEVEEELPIVDEVEEELPIVDEVEEELPIVDEVATPGPFDDAQANTTETGQDKPEDKPKEDPGFIANTLSGIRDAFTSNVNEVKGGKRKNRKSRKGLRTKRFSGGYRRKTRRGRRNSRRLRK